MRKIGEKMGTEKEAQDDGEIFRGEQYKRCKTKSTSEVDIKEEKCGHIWR